MLQDIGRASRRGSRQIREPEAVHRRACCSRAYTQPRRHRFSRAADEKPKSLEQWDTLEIALPGPRDGNPFLDVELDGHI